MTAEEIMHKLFGTMDQAKTTEVYQAMTQVVQSGEQGGTDTYCLSRLFNMPTPAGFDFQAWDQIKFTSK